jgi:hypothetical protein
MPDGTVASKFGSLNVVDPSPAPNVVPRIEKSRLYVVRETFWPPHINHPLGGVEFTHISTVPIGTMSAGANFAPS